KVPKKGTARQKSNGSRRQKMKNQDSPATKTMEIRLSRRSPTYWRVTFNHPPLNIFGPEGILEMNEIITALETDEHVKVVVFDSAVECFFLNHSDFLGRKNTLPCPLMTQSGRAFKFASNAHAPEPAGSVCYLCADRRPCCWMGCTHRTDKSLSPSQKF